MSSIALTSPQADQDLSMRVVNFLHDRHVPSLRQLEVSAKDGNVTLCGQVSTFYHKQLAIHACQRVAGVRRIIDQLDVPETTPESL